ncbi:Ferrodoxin [gamma proteobacterium HdN1]|nr:Ferrodoxin [gamma proteobacterium HdN1]
MAHVVLDNCINCKYTYCAEVCPVEAFHEGPNFLVIDPEACIDCMLCVPACITGSIMEERDVPHSQRSMVRANAMLSQQWPSIIERKPAFPDAEEWDKVPGKRRFLEMW